MDKKLIIKILVIVVSFGSSGLILYYGMFKDNSAPIPQGVTSSPPGMDLGDPGALNGSPVLDQDVLPKGDTLSFDKAVDPLRFNYNSPPYPKLDPANDIGIPVDKLIIPDVTN